MAPAGSTEPPPRSSRPGGHSTTKRPETDNHSGVHVNFDADDFTVRYRQILWMGSGGQAASFDPWVLLSTRFPSLNSMPAWTRATSSGLLTFRHRSWAASSSL